MRDLIERLIGVMTWKQVASIFIFVMGAVCASALAKNDTLAATLAGAAAGFAMMGQPRESQAERVKREKRESDSPIVLPLK